MALAESTPDSAGGHDARQKRRDGNASALRRPVRRGHGAQEVTQFVEESDCVVLLGTFMTDINLGIYTANLDPGKCIYATSEQLRIRHHHFHDVLLGDFIRELTAPQLRGRRGEPCRRALRRTAASSNCGPTQPITIMRLVARLDQSLDDNTIVIADIGDALVRRHRTDDSRPHRVHQPGLLHLDGLLACRRRWGRSVARPNMRTVVLVGDGAFQMTGNELSTIVRYGYQPVIIVLDNKGYGTERFLHPGNYNDIHPWKYHKLTEVFGGGTGYEVRTEGEFDRAFPRAWNDPSGMSLIQVHLAKTTAARRCAGWPSD